MRKIQYISTILFVLAFLSSCEKEINYKAASLNDFLVLNGNLMVDSVITCSVTKSVSILEKRHVHPVEDAVVELYKDDALLETLEYDSNGSYKSDHLLTEKDATYSIKVSKQGFNPVEAVTRTQAPADAEIYSITTNEETGKSRVKITINDIPGDDFYRIRIFSTVGEDDPLYSDYYYQSFWKIDLQSEDPVLNDNRVKTSDDYSSLAPNIFNIFNDELFEGQSYSLSFDISLREEKVSGVRIDMQKISRDLYLYYKTYQAREYSEDSPFSEPVRIHSNVSGGAGVLGSATSKWLKPKPEQIKNN